MTEGAVEFIKKLRAINRKKAKIRSIESYSNPVDSDCIGIESKQYCAYFTVINHFVSAFEITKTIERQQSEEMWWQNFNMSLIAVTLKLPSSWHLMKSSKYL